jgi:hypothetical protein
MGAGQAGFAVDNFRAEPSRSPTGARSIVARRQVLLEHGWTGIGADRTIANVGLAPRGRVLGLPAVA